MVRRFTVAFLIIIIGLVWYYILQHIKTISLSKGNVQSVYQPIDFDSTQKFDFVYRDLPQDPFIFENISKPDQKSIPEISLLGIVISKGKKLALIKTSDNNVYPLKEGEKFQEIKIIRITSGSVIIEANGHKDIFTLQKW